jgi:hypothetical protein
MLRAERNSRASPRSLKSGSLIANWLRARSESFLGSSAARASKSAVAYAIRTNAVKRESAFWRRVSLGDWMANRMAWR